jgi:hypothetical protein
MVKRKEANTIKARWIAPKGGYELFVIQLLVVGEIKMVANAAIIK